MITRAARKSEWQDRRAIFRIWADEQTCSDGSKRCNSRDIESCLAHKVTDKVEAAYRCGSAVAKRRQIMQAWADLVTAVANVVQLPVKEVA